MDHFDTMFQGYCFNDIMDSLMYRKMANAIQDKISSNNLEEIATEVWIVKDVDRATIFHRLEELGTVMHASSCRDQGIVIGKNFVMRVDISHLSLFKELSAYLYVPKNEGEKTVKKVERILEPLLIDLTGAAKVHIDWYYETKCEIHCRSTTEVFSDKVEAEAYPFLTLNDEPCEVDDFARAYLESPSSVLLLMGEQGTGKTRLIRHVVKMKGLEAGKKPRVVYTTDLNAISSETMYIEFRCSDHDFMVLEDIDNQLVSRSEGNNIMHKFLAASDGFIAANKKIILSTNLHIDEVDQALIRVGRCFASVATRKLTGMESGRLLRKIAPNVLGEFQPDRQYSLAEVYNRAFHTSSGMIQLHKKSMGFQKGERV